MADMLKITSLVNPKNYTMPTRPLAQSDAVFNLVDLTKVIKTNDRTQEFRQTENSTSEPNPNVLKSAELNISKSPSFSTNLLKGLLSEEFISQIMQSGSPDMINEFNEFAKNIFIQSENITADLATQHKGATSFNGEIFDILRQIASGTEAPDIKCYCSIFKKRLCTSITEFTFKFFVHEFCVSIISFYPSKNLSEKAIPNG